MNTHAYQVGPPLIGVIYANPNELMSFSGTMRMHWTPWLGCSSQRARSICWHRASSSCQRSSAAVAASSSWKEGTTCSRSPAPSQTPSGHSSMSPASLRSLTIRRCFSKSRLGRSKRRSRRPRASTRSSLAPKFELVMVPGCGSAEVEEHVASSSISGSSSVHILNWDLIWSLSLG